MNGKPTLEGFRQDLVAAASERNRHRRGARLPRPVVVAAAVAIAVAAVGTVALRPQSASASVDIRREGTMVVVTLADVEASPERVESDLREAGLDVTINALPAPPSLVGRFMTSEQRGPLPTAIEVVDGTRTTFDSFAFPVGWSGSLRLGIGRPARPGEVYARSANAFAAGEPLACSGWRGVPAARLADRHRRPDVKFDWRVVTASGAQQQIGASDLTDARWAELVVVDAVSVAPSVVVVRLGDPTAPRALSSDGFPDESC